MVTFRRLRLLAVVSILAGGAAVAAHAAAQSPAPGRYVRWVPSAQATATPGAGPAISVASASPGAATSGAFGGLTLPLSGLFGQLNSETRASAAGQYSILQELEATLAARIDQFLAWVTGRH